VIAKGERSMRLWLLAAALVLLTAFAALAWHAAGL
jgi:hypothetical protein